MTKPTIADVEARASALEEETQALRGDLTTIGVKVEQYHAATTTKLDEMTKVLLEIQSKMTRQGAPDHPVKMPEPDHPKGLDLGKGPKIEAPEYPAIGQSSDPYRSYPAFEGLPEETPRHQFVRGQGSKPTQGQVRRPTERPPYADHYLVEPRDENPWYDGVYRPRPHSEPTFQTRPPDERRHQPRPLAEMNRQRPARNFDSIHRRLDLPLFQGEDVRGWLNRAERYFMLNNLSEYERLDASVLCFEGKALQWFEWREERQPFANWEELRLALIGRFQGQPGRTHEEFFALVQETDVSAYRDRFEALSSGLGGMTNEALMGNFMKGLKAQIREGVRVLRPKGLEEAMYLAQLVEDEKAAERSNQRAMPSQRIANTGPDTGGAREPAGRIPNHRKMTEADVESRRTRGLCYRCDERWMPGHKCKAAALKIILVGDDDSDDEGLRADEETKARSNLELVEVSLNSLSGLTPTRSMKLKGSIAGREVLVLVDSGATHNFISKDLVEEKNLALNDRGRFQVVLGTGAVEESRGICPNISLELPGYTCRADFLPIRMRGTDAILGWQWLQSLGDVKTNWRSLHMEFMDGDKPVTAVWRSRAGQNRGILPSIRARTGQYRRVLLGSFSSKIRGNRGTKGS
ncbi:unnamed protein product [Rhodiola kirilowii]